MPDSQSREPGFESPLNRSARGEVYSTLSSPTDCMLRYIKTYLFYKIPVIFQCPADVYEFRDRGERSAIESHQLQVSARQIHVSSGNNGMFEEGALINYRRRTYRCSHIFPGVRYDDITDAVPQFNLDFLLSHTYLFLRFFIVYVRHFPGSRSPCGADEAPPTFSTCPTQKCFVSIRTLQLC